MKCRDCERLFVGEDNEKNIVYICFPKGEHVNDINEEFETCVFKCGLRGY